MYIFQSLSLSFPIFSSIDVRIYLPLFPKVTSSLSVSHLIDVVQFTSFLGPVAEAESVAVFSKPGEHHHHHTALLPHQLPKVCSCTLQWSLCGYVSWVPWVVVRLFKEEGISGGYSGGGGGCDDGRCLRKEWVYVCGRISVIMNVLTN